MAGYTAAEWVGMWNACHAPSPAGMVRTAWPDGGAYLDQPKVLIEVFGLIDVIVEELIEMERNRA